MGDEGGGQGGLVPMDGRRWGGGFPRRAGGRTECSAPPAVVTRRLRHSIVALFGRKTRFGRSRLSMTVRPAAPGYTIPVPPRLPAGLEQLGPIVVGKGTPPKPAPPPLPARG